MWDAASHPFRSFYGAKKWNQGQEREKMSSWTPENNEMEKIADIYFGHLEVAAAF